MTTNTIIARQSMANNRVINYVCKLLLTILLLKLGIGIDQSYYMILYNNFGYVYR